MARALGMIACADTGLVATAGSESVQCGPERALREHSTFTKNSVRAAAAASCVCENDDLSKQTAAALVHFAGQPL